MSPQTEVLYSKGCHTHKYLPRINEKLMKSSNGFLVEYFDGNNFDKNLIFNEYLIGNKFWVFEGLNIPIKIINIFIASFI